MILLLLLALNAFLLIVESKAISASEASSNRTVLRLTELMLGAHLFICAGSLLLKITYHHSMAIMVAALPVAIGGILSVIMPLLPKTIKWRYPRISFSNSNRKIIFE
jgi:hypothetical protein